MPPLDEAHAALLLPRSARCREMLRYLDKIFQLGAQLAAVANNLAMLGMSLASRQPHAPQDFNQGEFFDCSIEQINTLIQGVASAVGQMMALATVTSRHVWLGLTTVSKSDREDLLGDPVSPQGLFRSISLVAQCLKKIEEELLQLSHHFAHLKGGGEAQLHIGEEERKLPPRRSERALYMTTCSVSLTWLRAGATGCLFNTWGHNCRGLHRLYLQSRLLELPTPCDDCGRE